MDGNALWDFLDKVPTKKDQVSYLVMNERNDYVVPIRGVLGPANLCRTVRLERTVAAV